ncbi:MAG: XdhC family protein [Candidatus Bathyarchaeia archaeon]
MATDAEILKQLAHLLEEGRRIALCTIIEKKGSGPRNVGAKMIVSEDGKTVGTIGGGSLERALIDKSLKALREGKPKKAVFSLGGGGEGAIETGLICGGELTIFIDPIEPKQRLIVIGAGHVAYPLAKLADILGFSLVVVDDNEELANRERFPMAQEIITGRFNEILDKIEIGSRDFVVILHGEPEHDFLALEKIIKKRPAYVGLLGSKSKVTTLVKRLREAGISDEDLKLLHAPLGLDIGAQTPEEIGISILAEVINEKRKRRSSLKSMG